MGLTREDLEAADQPKYLHVWPDNWPAVTLLGALGTQWRVGFAGASGLDYNAVPFVLRMRRIPRERWPDVFDDLRVLERAALKAMRGEDDEDKDE